MVRALKVTRGRKLRVDSTVVETNIHHPTDNRVLGHGMRVVSRLLRRAKQVLGEAVDMGQEVLRTQTRTVRRLTQQIHRIARRKGEEAAEQMNEAYAKLIKVAKASRAQAQKACEALRERVEDTAQQLVGQFEHFLPLVERAIERAQRRGISSALSERPVSWRVTVDAIRRRTRGWLSKRESSVSSFPRPIAFRPNVRSTKSNAGFGVVCAFALGARDASVC